MASENKTRQEMIEMMYLVLTALLALNVSKEIVAAFVTINDKLQTSSQVIKEGSFGSYDQFTIKRTVLKTQKADTKAIDFWIEKEERLQERTKQVVSFLLSQSNEMIKRTEGEDWVAEMDDDGYIIELKSLMDIAAKDDYDKPTNLFVGSDVKNPKPEGWAIRDSIHSYRNDITELMANYENGGKKYTFTAPDDISGLSEALATANPEDTSKIAQIYRSLTQAEELEVSDAGKKIMLPWPSALFHHSPVVASAAIFTSMKLDVLNNESATVDFMLSKVDAPTFDFNKIEPLAFARTGYVNAGDSLDLKVMIAAYDSTDEAPIRYGINDSISSNWKEVKDGKGVKLETSTPGDYRVTGQIGVRERGQRTFKNWEFNYTVGKPSGTVSLPEMNVLYRGYDNKVEGAASGFPSFNLSGGGNVTLTKSGQGYIAKPGSGREATINISGIAEDGSSSSLGSFKFRVNNLPKPSIRLGRIEDGDAAPKSTFTASNRLFAGYPPAIPLKAEFSVVNWNISVSGAPRDASGNGASLNSEALRLISNAQPGGKVSVVVTYKEPGGTTRRQSAVYTVK